MFPQGSESASLSGGKCGGGATATRWLEEPVGNIPLAGSNPVRRKHGVIGVMVARLPVAQVARVRIPYNPLPVPFS